MKKLTLTIMAIMAVMACITNAFAQKDDTALIQEKLNHYLKGVRTNDTQLVKKAFHKTATMKFLNGEKAYTEMLALDAFQKVFSKNPSREGMTTKIHEIDVTDTAASVKLEIKFPTFTFTDYLNLLKIDGEWMIVGKIYTKNAHSK